MFDFAIDSYGQALISALILFDLVFPNTNEFHQIDGMNEQRQMVNVKKDALD
jgi:hypothetical protein